MVSHQNPDRPEDIKTEITCKPKILSLVKISFRKRCESKDNLNLPALKEQLNMVFSNRKQNMRNNGRATEMATLSINMIKCSDFELLKKYVTVESKYLLYFLVRFPIHFEVITDKKM